jgi:ABC-type dipeptide/oligopeptide/nickel transport system permease subunit
MEAVVHSNRPTSPASPPRVRGPWRLTWDRFRRDRVSLVAACLFAGVVFASFAGGPVASAILGHTSIDQFPYAANENGKPVGLWTRVPAIGEAQSDQYGGLLPPPKGTPTTLFMLGADGPLGRDELLRLLDGGRTSLEIGLGGVFIALLIGVPLGCLAGYFGGWTDSTVSRLTEIVMAFPLILFLVFASIRLSNTLTPIGYGSVVPSGVFAVALLIGLFTWFYPARLVRARMRVLRDTEFIDAARMVGASNLRIMRKHVLPHLVPALLVWAAIAVAANILLEVGISFIGVGVQASTPTWGSLLSVTWGTVYQPQTYNALIYTPWQTLLPTLAILLAVVSLNQVSEGFRRALEPWST